MISTRGLTLSSSDRILTRRMKSMTSILEESATRWRKTRKTNSISILGRHSQPNKLSLQRKRMIMICLICLMILVLNQLRQLLRTIIKLKTSFPTCLKLRLNRQQEWPRVSTLDLVSHNKTNKIMLINLLKSQRVRVAPILSLLHPLLTQQISKCLLVPNKIKINQRKKNRSSNQTPCSRTCKRISSNNITTTHSNSSSMDSSIRKCPIKWAMEMATSSSQQPSRTTITINMERCNNSQEAMEAKGLAHLI